MRHINDTAAHTPWSAAAPDRIGGFDLGRIGELPLWLSITAGVLGIAVLAGVFQAFKHRARARAKQAAETGQTPGGLAQFGAQSVTALGGVAISVFGLWGFATDQAKLPAVLCIGFISIFDVSELTLFWMLHQAANQRMGKGWSSGMLRIRSMAWSLVAFSAAMNAYHAETPAAKIILAAIPAFSAKLIELQVETKLYGDGDAERLAGRPGPVRLVVLGWQHTWSELFAWLGLDAGSSNSEIARAARAKRAAASVHELRKALADQEAAKTATGRRGRRGGPSDARLEKLRRRARTAIDRADLATDSAQALDVARRFTGMSRIDELARVEVEQGPTEIMELLQDIAVAPSVARLQADVLLAEAEEARRKAEQEAVELREEAERAAAAARQNTDDAQQEADDARKRSEAARKAADDATAKAAETRLAAEKEAAAIREEATRLAAEKNEEAARSAAARQETDAARNALAEELAAARAELDQLREGQRALVDETRAQGEALQLMREEAAELDQHNKVARRLLERQRGELTSQLDADENGTPVAGADGPVFARSAGKQRGWELYRAVMLSSDPAEPSVDELARVGDCSQGRARAWLGEFRDLLAREMAAALPAQTAGPGAEQMPSTAERNRATAHISRAGAAGMASLNGSPQAR